ncbi:hypothetical protein [Fodinicurvata sp. EGI_FJ10296]|uniref:hypothetical protein n=1 Tax=Fodinicurvata sp. EGI_FJ10296 TaxID=3231908 RepID=UPI0034528AD8
MAEESARAYAMRQVRDAIAKSDGDRGTARRMVLQACARDARLLGGLTGPFLKGIIAHAMENAGEGAGKSAASDKDADTSGRAKAKARSKAPSRPKSLSNEGLDAVIGTLTERIGAAPGQSRGAAILSGPKPTKAGDKHRQSLQTLARAFARKRYDQRFDPGS